MIPLLPIPVTTTRPPQECKHSTARSNSPAMGPAMRSPSSRRASASMRTTLAPTDFTGNILALKNQKIGSRWSGDLKSCQNRGETPELICVDQRKSSGERILFLLFGSVYQLPIVEDPGVPWANY